VSREAYRQTQVCHWMKKIQSWCSELRTPSQEEKNVLSWACEESIILPRISCLYTHANGVIGLGIRTPSTKVLHLIIEGVFGEPILPKEVMHDIHNVECIGSRRVEVRVCSVNKDARF